MLSVSQIIIYQKKTHQKDAQQGQNAVAASVLTSLYKNDLLENNKTKIEKEKNTNNKKKMQRTEKKHNYTTSDNEVIDNEGEEDSDIIGKDSASNFF